MSFLQKIQTSWHTQRSFLCIGLDPDLRFFPGHLSSKADAISLFCKAIIDATADLACAFKPQIAYFSAHRAEEQLEDICTYLRAAYPHIPIILDAKRGDIGATAQQYAVEAFERYQADAVTLNPYMGFDSIEPYLEWHDRGLFILCRTSNPGGNDLQNLPLADQNSLLYEYIAQLVKQRWNLNGQCGLVVGATVPEELAKVREIVQEMPLLIPGIGAQGGSIEAAVKAGFYPKTGRVLFNSSRAILYADPTEEFAAAARTIALQTRDAINRFAGISATSMDNTP